MADHWLEKFEGDGLCDTPDGVEFEVVKGRAGPGQVNLKGVLGKGWEKLGLEPEKLRDADHFVARYDAEIACADEWVGRMLETLAEQAPEALVVLTSDHGESMTEHDYFFFHGRYCYEPGCHVPLVVRHPDRGSGVRERRLVSLVDVFPTLSDLIGIAPPDVVEGRSFANVWHSEFRAEPMGGPRSVVDIEARSARSYRIRGVRGERWKLIMTPRRGTWPFDLLLEMQLSTRPAGRR
jgi:arylsulfatase A-like enzyme